MYVTCKYTATVYSVYLYCVLLRLQRFLCPIVALSFLPLVLGEKETNWQMEKTHSSAIWLQLYNIVNIVSAEVSREKQCITCRWLAVTVNLHWALGIGTQYKNCTTLEVQSLRYALINYLILPEGRRPRVGGDGGKWKGSAESKFSLRGLEIPEEAKTKWENRDEQKSFGKKKRRMKRMGRVKVVWSFVLGGERTWIWSRVKCEWGRCQRANVCKIHSKTHNGAFGTSNTVFKWVVQSAIVQCTSAVQILHSAWVLPACKCISMSLVPSLSWG